MVKKFNLFAIPLCLIFSWIERGVSAIDLIPIVAYAGILVANFRERLEHTPHIELNDLEDIKTFLDLMNKGYLQANCKYFSSPRITNTKSKPLYCAVHPLAPNCNNCKDFAQEDDV